MQLSSSLLFFLLVLTSNLLAQTPTPKVLTPTSDSIISYPLQQLNSKYRDVNISVTPNGKYLYFMTGRGNTPWSNRGDVVFRDQAEFDGDIWYSKRIDTTWQRPKYLPPAINTRRGEDEPNISVDGQTVYFQSWKTGWERSGGPYYRAELYGEKWENPTGLGSGINQFFRDSMAYYLQYATDGMAISPDGRIFIVAAGVDYDGKLDLYISRKDKRNNWSYPKRMDISTSGDERSIFIAGDGKTIYFGSDGHGGSGGLDIFKATLYPNDSCSALINIGAPFNTPENDYGFTIRAAGDEAYFVRNSDIYYARLGAASTNIKPTPTLLIDGIVRDCEGNASQAKVELYRLSNSQLLMRARSNAISGEYALAIPKDTGSYLQRFVFSEGGTRKEVLHITEEGPDTYFFEITPNCKKEIKEAEVHELIVYFDFDQDQLLPETITSIDTFLTQFSDTETYEFYVIGHTDSEGSDDYNIRLSERRAQTVVDYISAQKRTFKQTIDFKGEGEPVLGNITDKQRASNRRVEIKIRKINADQ